MATMSTVGYGDFSPGEQPLQPFMRALTVIYILVGIILVFTRLKPFINALTKPLFKKSRSFFERLPAWQQTPIDIDGNGQADYLVPRDFHIWFIT